MYNSLDVQTYIVNGLVRNSDLRGYSVLQTLKENILLHVTEVPSYSEYGELTEVSFITLLYPA